MRKLSDSVEGVSLGEVFDLMQECGLDDVEWDGGVVVGSYSPVWWRGVMMVVVASSRWPDDEDVDASSEVVRLGVGFSDSGNGVIDTLRLPGKVLEQSLRSLLDYIFATIIDKGREISYSEAMDKLYAYVEGY